MSDFVILWLFQSVVSWLVCLDDVIVFSAIFKEHREHLRESITKGRIEVEES